MRETWWGQKGAENCVYRADYPSLEFTNRWRPSIHMPRWASRLTLELTDVRVERLQDISEEDVRAEGMDSSTACSLLPHGHGNGRDLHAIGCGDLYDAKPNTNDWTAHDCWRVGWSAINGDESWSANPWVWVLGFRRLP